MPVAPPDPKMLLIFGLFWDEQQNPHCPVDKAPLFIVKTVSPPQDPDYDMLKCPSCQQEYPIRSASHGRMTLFEARVTIRDHVARGITRLL